MVVLQWKNDRISEKTKHKKKLIKNILFTLNGYSVFNFIYTYSAHYKLVSYTACFVAL